MCAARFLKSRVPRFSRQPLATAYPPERASRDRHLTLLPWTISSSARQHAAGCCFVPDCERVLVTAGGAAGTSDGDARFAGVVSIAGR